MRHRFGHPYTPPAAAASPKGVDKQTLDAQLDRPEADAYAIAVEVMAGMSQSAGAKEGMAAFLEKRHPSWPD